MAVRYELQSYAEWLANDHVRRQTGAVRLEDPSLSDDTIALLKLWQDDQPVSVASVTDLAGQLAKLSLPVINIMLAAPPHQAFRHDLVKWFREVGGDDYLVSITINRTIGGGVIIRTPNHYYDLSYGHRVMENRDKLPAIVRSLATKEPAGV